MKLRKIRPVMLISAAVLAIVLITISAPMESRYAFAAPQQKPAQTQITQPAPSDPTAGVEVTAMPLPASKYCEFGPKAYVIYVPLDITIANGRRTPIILTRYLHIQQLLIAKTAADVQAQKYDLATRVRPFRSFGEGVNFGSPPSDNNWVVLKHNQTYEFTDVEGIPVRNNGVDEVPGTVVAGDLAISFELQTWPFSRDPSASQREWSRFGDLISAPVISYPTLAKVPVNPQTEKCGLLAP